MFFPSFFFVLLIAMVLTLIFAMGLGRHRSGTVLLMFFIILFLATWAGGLWIHPVGPPTWGVPWLSFLIVGFILAIMLAALIPPAPRNRPVAGEGRPESEEEKKEMVAFNAFVWILLVALVVAIILRFI
jgi:type VI protein secretion system component VasK